MELLRLCGTVPEAARDAVVIDAIDAMIANKSGALAVMEGRNIVGVFTERDLMQRVVARRLDPAKVRVGEVMSSPVVTISASAPAVAAARMMRERHIRHLAVIDDAGTYKGLVALRFVLYRMLAALDAKVDELYSFMMTDTPGGD